LKNTILGILGALGFHFQVTYHNLQVKCKSGAALFRMDIEEPTVSVVAERVCSLSSVQDPFILQCTAPSQPA